MVDHPLPAAPATLTHESAIAYLHDCLETLRRSSAGSEASWTLDVSGLTHFDSAALAALLAVHRTVRGRGERLRLTGLPTRLSDLATLYGVRDLLPA